jgi:hypothetical protein
VLDIAHDQCLAAIEVLQDFAGSERIQQCLGGMRVPAIASIDNGRGCIARDQIGDAGLLMADHDVVQLHRLQGLHRIQDRFSFDDAGQFDIKVGHVGRKTAGGDFEGRARARRGLVKKRQHGAPPGVAAPFSRTAGRGL